MYCKNCGEIIDDQAVICPKCGVAQTTLQKGTSLADHGGFLWGLLGFLFPLVGLILFLVWRDDKPLNARAVGIGALVSVIVGFVSAFAAIVIPIIIGITAASV